MLFERSNQNTKTKKTAAVPAHTETFDLELAQAMAESEGFANLPHPDSNFQFRRRATSGSELRDRWIAAREAALRFSESAADKLRELPNESRELAGKIDTHARANPWLHIGIASAGGLLIGLAAGRFFASGQRAPSESSKGYDFDQAMDE